MIEGTEQIFPANNMDCREKFKELKKRFERYREIYLDKNQDDREATLYFATLIEEATKTSILFSKFIYDSFNEQTRRSGHGGKPSCYNERKNIVRQLEYIIKKEDMRDVYGKINFNGHVNKENRKLLKKTRHEI